MIESLWNQGRTVGEIVRHLNENGYRSRLNRDWGYGVVKGIIQRLRDPKE
ncbi:MAG: recombinase family protein [Bdellovibrionaceae bacterium]|nr:recombinase family protein [Pseudobdellovibrionaceae bacterium]